MMEPAPQPETAPQLPSSGKEPGGGDGHAPELSVVLPVYNEAACIRAVLEDLAHQRPQLPPTEILAVDDGSTDGTLDILRQCRTLCRELRVLHLRPHAGQSAALVAGFRHARGRWIVTMDADGQMDPADLPNLVRLLGPDVDAVFGYRLHRQDAWSKIIASRLANAVRNALLHESIRDTGCPFKAFRADLVRELPVWDGIHRFFSSFLLAQGARIVQVPVRHRPRIAGESKYTNLRRLRRTLADVLAVRWWKQRVVRFTIEEIQL